jgi:hypothetical protein
MPIPRLTGTKFGGGTISRYTFLKYVYFDFSNKNKHLKKIGGLLLSSTVSIPRSQIAGPGPPCHNCHKLHDTKNAKRDRDMQKKY